MSTKLNPGQFDCYNAALPNEEVFVLLARDPTSPATIRDWCDRRIAAGKNQPTDQQIVEALECADRMDAQRELVRGALNAMRQQ